MHGLSYPILVALYRRSKQAHDCLRTWSLRDCRTSCSGLEETPILEEDNEISHFSVDQQPSPMFHSLLRQAKDHVSLSLLAFSIAAPSSLVFCQKESGVSDADITKVLNKNRLRKAKPDTRYENLPEQDPPTSSHLCKTYQQGPCRDDWRKLGTAFVTCIRTRAKIRVHVILT